MKDQEISRQSQQVAEKHQKELDEVIQETVNLGKRQKSQF